MEICLQRGFEGIKIIAMSLLNVGPEGLLLVWGALVSLVVALLTWRHAGLALSLLATLAVAMSIATWEIFGLEPASFGHQVLRALFIIVPSVLLLGASRLSWLARQAWVLLFVGPILFVGCFVGICECAYRFFGA